MPELTVTVGGKPFTVACEEGQEPFLRAAADMLDREAQSLLGTGARLTTDRMLLMAGLMLADRAGSADEELRAMDRRLAQQTKLLDEMQERAEAPRPAPERVEVTREVPVEVPVVPDAAVSRLRALAERAEAVAAKAG
ncbi:cell division protein ZapA [Jannaschia sp. W003]|uniref:cell division protein ZapA n=1 Tax=Jannaschia sp. W003 TaxID=2867012 RepID=UPI0021A5E8B1|nr:cell division protein ZapA [Jannaschia sp. W003]UWQ20687.1 cell division protein ZapA [Jannaschia sp. W003]